MKKTDAIISLHVFVDCPYCENTIDLFDLQHLCDDGYIYSQLLGERFGKSDWNEIIECPDCKEKFIIENVEW